VVGLGLVATTDEPATAEESDSFMSLVARVSNDWSEETAGLVGGLLFGKAFLQANPTFLGEWADSVSRLALKDMLALGRAIVGRPDNTPVAAQLSVPTVVIHGEADAGILLETGVRLADRIPKATLVRIPAVGHCPPVEAPSAVTAEVIRLAEVCLS
jgi:pimeloyl-ACP methyl ester carboxylesterase